MKTKQKTFIFLKSCNRGITSGVDTVYQREDEKMVKLNFFYVIIVHY